MSQLAIRSQSPVALGAARRDLSQILAEGASAARPARASRDLVVLQPRAISRMPEAPPKTVGEHYWDKLSGGAGKVGRFLHGLAELTVVPLVGEIAFFKGRQVVNSYDRILDLPYDPAGRWREAADRIKAEEARRANQAIANLPLISGSRAVGGAVVDGTVAAGRAVARGVEAVGDYATDAALTTVRGVREAGRVAGRTAIGAIGDLGQSLVDFAEDNRSNFR
ncbi:MAG: hypothetical protein VKO21_05655 [Candidatus Sericytochromatia bacterium]|nr:hypothetical protein [Candidatus Sericytochromatia bacterium]